jgi:tRNA 2-selenouridine synthase
MPEVLNIEDFFSLMETIPLVDVRSPGEFAYGHIPQAINIPVFNDEERKLVGIRYKQSGKDFAIKLGMKIVEPKKEDFINNALATSTNNKLLVHCWRGGMRSEKMAELFETAGIQTKILFGGYNSYRRYIREEFADECNIKILGGFTGSGKTDVLKALKMLGEQIIDLEGIANHKGSAFGEIGQLPQPTNEQFENNLAQIWSKLDKTKRIWIEDESITLGINGIPETLWKQMRMASVLKINIPVEIRVERLLKEYSGLNKSLLINSLNRIRKRLGNDKLKNAISALENNDYKKVAEIALFYYDKAYLKGISQRNPNTVKVIDVFEDNPIKSAKLLLKLANSR